MSSGVPLPTSWEVKEKSEKKKKVRGGPPTRNKTTRKERDSWRKEAAENIRRHSTGKMLNFRSGRPLGK